MSMGRLNQINPKILKQCRSQIGLDSLEEAIKATGIGTLTKIEGSGKEPTYNQIKKLAEVYCVPSWVFYLEKLPPEFDLNSHSFPEFRTLQGANARMDYKLRKVIWKFSNYRKILLEEFEESQIEIQRIDFKPDEDPIGLATKVRDWLGYSWDSLAKQKTKFERINYWKELVENKDILIFTTSVYLHWSKVDVKTMRGMAIYKEKFPIIIINGSDALSANIFTLMHELGHILLKKVVLDVNISPFNNITEEKFCNDFASEMLMPIKEFESYIKKYDKERMDDFMVQGIAEEVAEEFKVSTWVALVKLRASRVITQQQYKDLEEELKKNTSGFVKRNRPQEIVNFYGKTYIRTVLQLYHDEKITLNKLCNALGVKGQVGYVKAVEKML